MSHGSILLHSALVRLQIDPDAETNWWKKIVVFTIGSPKYIPKNILPFSPNNTPNVFNFFHVNDPYLKVFASIFL